MDHLVTPIFYCIRVYVCVYVTHIHVCDMCVCVYVTHIHIHWARVREIAGSNPGQVKPMTYKIDTCHSLARCSAL